MNERNVVFFFKGDYHIMPPDLTLCENPAICAILSCLLMGFARLLNKQFNQLRIVSV